jgi:hypothetical protein
MDKNLSNFPLLFERIGSFLTLFADLREKRRTMSPEEFVAEFDKFVKPNGPSDPDAVVSAINEITLTLYIRTFVGNCPGGGTRQR